MISKQNKTNEKKMLEAEPTGWWIILTKRGRRNRLGVGDRLELTGFELSRFCGAD